MDQNKFHDDYDLKGLCLRQGDVYPIHGTFLRYCLYVCVL